MNDPADDPPVVNTARAGFILRKLRFDQGPSVIVQPENFTHHRLQGAFNALELHI
jgi:hypothetical protein